MCIRDSYNPDKTELILRAEELGVPVAVGGLEMLVAQAVSYTHLDVYKRQVLFFGGVLAALGAQLLFQLGIVELLDALSLIHISMGYVPFVSSFAMFAAGRAFEQIRNSIAYPRLNVKIGATHGGISVGEDGASHQCCEDFALMRCV